MRNKELNQKIHNLKEEGKTYLEITKIINCSLSTVNYHLNLKSREKALIRNSKREFRKLENAVSGFQQRSKGVRGKDKSKLNRTFSVKDVIDKFSIETKCYLSGRIINLKTSKYSLDHIIPVYLGGDNSFNNLGITDPDINYAKGKLSKEDFIKMCKDVVKYNS